MKAKWCIIWFPLFALYAGVPSEAQNANVAERIFKTESAKAEKGDPADQISLGNLYEMGFGVPKDDVEAVKWYRKAAEKEDADGQYRLAYMYYKGNGIQQDAAEAFKWCRKSAEQGNPSGQIMLAGMYDDGSGVEQDHSEAFKWYRKAG